MLVVKDKLPLSNDEASFATDEVVVPFYQPIIGQKNRVIGFEVLARRWDPQHQCYQGVNFPSLTEEESLHLDIVMLRAIYLDLPALAKGRGYTLSINLNPALSNPIYHELLLLLLSQARKLDITIWLEVVEYAPLHPQDRALIEMLRSHGAHIACDDFGTQVCNFQRVMALPYEVIKLDRSLLLQATNSRHSLRMLAGLVEYLQRLGMKVVCEGVETMRHIETANKLGCDYQQGYAYARPSLLSRWT